MKILYGGRFVRMDILRIIGLLACAFTRWTSECDKRLFRLVSYIDSIIAASQCGWIGDPLDALFLVLYADVDFAGCVDSEFYYGSFLVHSWPPHMLAHSWH